MIADLLPGREPALHDMALSAIGAEFSQMNIGVTIGAILSDVGKYRLRMTLRADYFFMPAAQRVLGLVVIEFGSGANRSPTVVVWQFSQGMERGPCGFVVALCWGRRKEHSLEQDTRRSTKTDINE